MDLAAFEESQDKRASFQNEGEGEAIGEIKAFPEHSFVEKDGFFGGVGELGGAPDHGVPGEDVWVGNLGEQAAGVGDVAGGGEGAEGEDLGEGVEGGGIGGCFEEVSMDLAQGSHIRAFLDQRGNTFCFKEFIGVG